MNPFGNSAARILVIAAHADDEVLGAGGALFSAIRAGSSVHVAILSTASSSRGLDDAAQLRLQTRRIEAAQAAARMMGWTLSLHDYPDNAFDTYGLLTIAKTIEQEIASFKPTLLLTHFPGDLSTDHQQVATATLAVSRPIGRHAPSTVLFFEIASSTNWSFGQTTAQFAPSLWVELDEAAFQAKARAIELYADEMREWPHRRSLEGIRVQARYRGSEVSLDMAEAFVVARSVSRAQ
jgi:LmbE family N-acetylglucosaminyl deacetylase